MAHLRQTVLLLPLIILFLPILAKAQQPMTIGLKGYATGVKFERYELIDPAEQGPQLTFTNKSTFGVGICFESELERNFRWALELGRLFERHTVQVEGVGSFKSFKYPLYRASGLLGYRLPIRDHFSFALLTGIEYQFKATRAVGISYPLLIANQNEYYIYESFASDWYIPLRLDVGYILSKKWSCNASVQAAAPLYLTYGLGNSYIVNQYENNNQMPLREAIIAMKIVF